MTVVEEICAALIKFGDYSCSSSPAICISLPGDAYALSISDIDSVNIKRHDIDNGIGNKDGDATTRGGHLE
jgi:hypothetical protein